MAELSTVVLVVGLGFGAYYDWTTREVTDHLWQVIATIGVLVGIVVVFPNGHLALGAWLAVSALALTQLFPWDLRVEGWDERLPDAIEAVGFLAVTAFLVWAGVTYGVGSSGLPITAIAAFASILLGRGLFEVRLLYGGADAKALITTGVMVPIAASPWVSLPATATSILAIYPFSLTLLMNAALVSIALPIYLAIRNLRAREFAFPRGFTGMMIPVSELPERFVWLKDPTFQPADEVETAEDDLALRTRQRADLEARGVRRIWVTPQVPFLVLVFAGAVLGVAFGNLVFDLLAYL